MLFHSNDFTSTITSAPFPLATSTSDLAAATSHLAPSTTAITNAVTATAAAFIDNLPL